MVLRNALTFRYSSTALFRFALRDASDTAVKMSSVPICMYEHAHTVGGRELETRQIETQICNLGGRVGWKRANLSIDAAGFRQAFTCKRGQIELQVVGKNLQLDWAGVDRLRPGRPAARLKATYIPSRDVAARIVESERARESKGTRERGSESKKRE